MKKTKILAIILLAIISMTFFLGSNVLATDTDVMPINEEGVAITGEQTPASGARENADIHEGDLYIAAGNKPYVMDQMVDGNVFIFGNNVTVTGEINGSLFVCGSNIEITKDAYVAFHLFAFANELTIDGMILDVYAAANNLKLGENVGVYRQIIAVADKMELAGNVGRDAFLYGEDINVTGEEFTVYGNLNYQSKNKIANEDKLKVEGETKFNLLKEKDTDSTVDVVLEYVFGAIGTVAFDVIIYLALLFLAPKFVKKAKEYVSVHGLLALAIGLAFVILVPIIAFILLITGVLAGLGVFTALVYSVVLMLNAFIVVVASNEFVAAKLKIDDKLKKGLLLAPVSLVLWALRKLPFIGWLISTLVCLAGVGIIILYQFDKRKEA